MRQTLFIRPCISLSRAVSSQYTYLNIQGPWLIGPTQVFGTDIFKRPAGAVNLMKLESSIRCRFVDQKQMQLIHVFIFSFKMPNTVLVLFAKRTHTQHCLCMKYLYFSVHLEVELFMSNQHQLDINYN